jgi:hypothetical protein
MLPRGTFLEVLYQSYGTARSSVVSHAAGTHTYIWHLRDDLVTSRLVGIMLCRHFTLKEKLAIQLDAKREKCHYTVYPTDCFL